VAALKRQLLQFSDIAERYATTHREGEMEPGMQVGGLGGWSGGGLGGGLRE
jgi:hypothetical protein